MTSSPDPQQRVGRVTVALVVVMLAGALVVQTFKTVRDDQALAAPAFTTAAGSATEPRQPDIALQSLKPGAEEPIYTFVSAPDLLNADIGDVRTLPTWREGMPNSDNKTDEDSLRRLYTEMRSWNPDALFVAGDEVRGHWDQDGSDLKIFGPVDTDAEKREAIRKAADFYYETWKNRVRRRLPRPRRPRDR
jgi:hypothetical protein